MESVDIWPIARKVAHKYGLKAEDLEAGTFLPEQIPILQKMLDRCMETNSPCDLEAYLNVKAQMMYLSR